MRRSLRFILRLGVLGLVTTLAIAWVLAAGVDVQQGSQSSADRFEGEEHWTITRLDRAGAAQITSIRERVGDVPWSPQQAAGKPDCPQLGDQHNAWASLGTSSPEWLILEYPKAVIPRRVDVYESYNPGAVVKVTLFDEQGKEVEGWSGVDPTPPGATQGNTPVSKIPITASAATSRIKLYIASDKVPGWNEIDAVGLIDDQGNEQWAKRVSASSTYASSYGLQRVPQGDAMELAPSWSGLRERTPALRDGQITCEERRIDARGWPMLALFSSTQVAAAPSSSAGSNPNLLDDISLEPSLSSGSTVGPGPMSSSGMRMVGSAPPGSGTMPARQTGISPGSGYSGASPFVYSGSSLGGTVALTTPSGVLPASGALPVPAPFHPIWIGLAGDTLFYGVAWFALWALLVIPRRFVREVARMRRGGCVQCGYDLGFDFIHGCPECGWRRDHGSAPVTSRAGVSERVNGN